MKALFTAAAVGMSLLAPVDLALAQPYGYDRRDSGYDRRDSGYRDRDYDRRGRYDDDDRGGRSRGRDFDRAERGGGFDERAYVRCNPDVAQALRNGQLTSALAHYQKFGRREGRRLSC
ncbi:hypothetical protein PMNALOAF_1682 [Methylobacterium adhaesivum]|jgi:hypothetical protein|uniref:Lectin-like protein BA14k n=1 Tax=Methylobacterium adhaesivum TaxID=333297 RepID=A0ABT8BDN8_9HYPH|nr:hypothetical protein [Methylobacterium adhaesivum]MDN3589418.1 hypothetical protein [Methylobacterium adhaesivum]GJD30435.1 hypothetical protein PMNALOAF_1682 [Methylobacterium adhaesivum]